MVKNKLKKFAQINTFSNVVQPADEYPVVASPFRGKWGSLFFRNDHPIILEVGCGKGDYTLNLGRAYPQHNFIGIDIKGDRIWKGASEALEDGLFNVAFLRIQAERLPYYFDKNEVSGIWLTFPDPQKRKSRQKKRLTSPQFLSRYRQILKPECPIHLKTDSVELFDYTLEVIGYAGHQLLIASRDLYGDARMSDPVLTGIKTYYERKFLTDGMPIHYLKFYLSNQHAS